MGRIPPEVIERVRDRVDIVELIGRFVSLKQAGRSFKGLCPFHGEKTPSFVVTPERQSFKCFGCGEGGNAFGFLMKMENLSFPEAVRTLAAQHGIDVPEARGEGEGGESAALHDANAAALAFFREQLAQPGNPGRAYLDARGIGDDLIARFEIGFAPDRWDGLTQALAKQRIRAEIGERAGLLAPRRGGGGYYDRLRGRVVFPIRDVRGRVIGFGGRAIAKEQEPKYLNSPETPIFRKREAFFGFPAALEAIRREERAVVVEGYFDLIALQRAGVGSVLATCGTALTEEHARNLRRRTRRVVLLFDGDAAGQKAMQRSLEVLLPEGLRVAAAVLPPGEDPDDFLAKRGGAALHALVAAAPPALEACIQRAAARGVSTPAQKADAVAEVAPLLALVESDVERGAYEQQLAFAVGAREEDVRTAVQQARRGADPREALPVHARVEPTEVRKLRRLARSLVEHPALAPDFDPDLLDGLAGHPVVELVLRLLDASSAERSFDLERVAEGLSAQARSLLFEIANEELPLEQSEAERTLADTRRWLAQRGAAQLQRSLTDEIRSASDPLRQLELLRTKAAQKRSRRTASEPGADSQ